jgi:hypothetical protein
MAISVLRGGETAYAWSGEGWAVRLDHADHAMLIKFKIPQKLQSARFRGRAPLWPEPARAKRGGLNSLLASRR